MVKLKIRKRNSENKLVGRKFRHYVDFVILVCCLVVTFNIHPTNNNGDDSTEKQKMLYIFHDYAGNEYILNDSVHGSADSRDYLFNDEIPEEIKGDEIKTSDSVSLSNMTSDNNQSNENTGNADEHVSVKDNQVSLKDMMVDLGVNDKDSGAEKADNNQLIIDLSDSGTKSDSNEPYYIVTEESGNNNDSKLIIEKMEESGYVLLTAKTFTFTSDGWVIPILVYWDELKLNNSNGGSIAYIDNSGATYEGKYRSNTKNSSGVTIIKDYADCMTPWGYKIDHGDSVLAYQQMDNAPNICNIERRFCWNGKLSGTYTQQGCSINENYTYEKWGEAVVNNDNDNSKSGSNKNDRKEGDVRQNPDGSVTVNKPLGTGSFVFDRPSKTSTPEYNVSDNVKVDEEVDQTTRPHWDCTAPWGEKVKHGQFVQAFKHANGFADAPCEAQLRLCSMGDLMGAYTESTCKSWDSSFIDWVNGSPNGDKHTKEKIEWIKKQIENEQIDYEKIRKNVKRSTKSDELDRILYILDNY